jgi:hypothetical protein
VVWGGEGEGHNRPRTRRNGGTERPRHRAPEPKSGTIDTEFAGEGDGKVSGETMGMEER